VSTIYPEIFKTFRFLVEVESGGAIVAAFSQFSGVKVTVETIEARPGSDPRGVKETVPALTTFAPVTLTKGVIGDNAFIDWLLCASAGMDEGPKGGDKLYRTINIIALDERGKRGVTWSLKNALPIGYELTPMDASRSEVLSESLTFAISGVRRTVH
jgi:phage tail-like protein